MQPWVAPLLAKYTEMQRLRRGDLGGTIPDPQPAMRALAREFPGVLREIDEMPLDEIERRVGHLAGLKDQGRDPGKIEGWEAVLHRFHTLLRGALCAKHWLAGRKDVDAQIEQGFELAAGSFCFAEDALAWRGQLAAIASPPRGRITDLVLARLSQESGLEPPTLDGLIFPHARRARSGRVGSGAGAAEHGDQGS
jgi:hypothetical protein